MTLETKVIKCILCVNECPAQNNLFEDARLPLTFVQGDDDGGVALKTQLQVIFLLRKVLEIPQDICCTFLEHYGNPCSWIDCCHSCSVLVQNSKHIFDQMMQLQKQFKTAQDQMKTQISGTVPSAENSDGDVKLGVRETIRSFLSEQDLTSTIKKHNGVTGTTFGKVENQSFKNENDNFSYALEDFFNEADAGKDPLMLDETLEANDNQDNFVMEDSFSPFQIITRFPEPECTSGEIVIGDFGISSCGVNESSEETKYSSVLFSSSTLEEANQVSLTNEKNNQNNFQCAICGKHLSTSFSLKRHEVFIHSGENEACDSSCNQGSNLKPHQGVHSRQKRFGCSICGKTFPRSLQLTFHKKSHATKKPGHKCDVCGKFFSRPFVLTQHKRSHTGETPYKCDVCGIGLSSSTLLNDHKRKHNNEKPFACKLCKKSFANFGALRHHEKTHAAGTEFECEICGKTFQKLCSLNTHQRIHTGEKPYKCEICGKAFSWRSSFAKHEIMHKMNKSGEKPYKCKFCGKAYSVSSVLIRHERSHTGETPFKCDICGVAWRTSSQLNDHKRKHNNENPFQCKDCEKSFPNYGDLKNHGKSHVNIVKNKKFECDLCDKAFPHFSVLQKHKRIHTGEKPYECQICKKSFSWLSSFTKHELMHEKSHSATPYQCQNCEKSFPRLGELKNHEKIHSYQNKLECKVCHKTFPHPSSLTVHSRLHTGEKPYECQICRKAFSWLSSFNKHKRTHKMNDTKEKSSKNDRNAFSSSDLLTNQIQPAEVHFKFEIEEVLASSATTTLKKEHK